jgi:hypothetical protein
MEINLPDLAALVPPALSSALTLFLGFYVWKLDQRMIAMETKLNILIERFDNERNANVIFRNRSRTSVGD